VISSFIPLSLSLAHAHTFSLSLSLRHTHTHIHNISLSLSHSHILFSLSFFLSPSLAHTSRLSLSLSHSSHFYFSPQLRHSSLKASSLPFWEGERSHEALTEDQKKIFLRLKEIFMCRQYKIFLVGKMRYDNYKKDRERRKRFFFSI
jgi:hypothetical protein